MKKSIIILSILILSGCIDYKERLNNFLKNGKRTKATVTGVSGNVYISYEVNGKEYDYVYSKPHKYIEEGEMFEIAYMPEDPNNALPLYFSPIINDTDYNITSVKTMEVDGEPNPNGTYSVFFTYTVKNMEFERLQKFLSVDFDLKQFEVLYKKDEPYIGYRKKKIVK